MARWPVTYFLFDRVFDTGEIESDSPPDSLAYFCASCGRVWGRAYIEGTTWHQRTTPCERHWKTGVADWATVPGSFLPFSIGWWSVEVSTMFWAATLDYLPPKVLSRELRLALLEVERSEHTEISGT
jgi:hypothetical protein